MQDAAPQPLTMFSTDDLPPEQRFDHWRETRGKNLFGVSIELDPDRRASFRGRFSARNVGGAVIADMQASAYRVSRTAADISHRSGDSFGISHQIKGPGWLGTDDGRVHAVKNGSLLVSQSDEPYWGAPSSTGDFAFRTLKIPLAVFPAFREASSGLLAQPVDDDAKLKTLMMGLLRRLGEQPGYATCAEQRVAVEHIAALALLARGRLGQRAPESRAALHAGYYQAALDLIAAHFHHPGFAAETAAAALGISVRQLHLLFEPSGLSFARSVTSQRLKTAQRLLLEHPGRTISDIAGACGFDSIATFYRLFRRTFGMAPNDMRAEL